MADRSVKRRDAVRGRARACWCAWCVVLGTTGGAWGQVEAAAPPAQRADDEGEEPAEKPWRPGQPFAANGGQGALGVFRARRWGTQQTKEGLSLSSSMIAHAEQGRLYAGVMQGGWVRWFGGWDLAGGYLYDAFAGVKLGPVAPEVRVGMTSLSLDRIDGQWSAQLFSPRVGAGVGFWVGSAAVSVIASSEHYWRWFGPDFRVYGVSVDVRLLSKRYPMDLSKGLQ